nr:MAG TPA: hypothetical protein [Caudoviricetes sp.]
MGSRSRAWDAPEVDLGKANNYAHRLVTGDWRAAKQGERGVR